MLVSPFSKIFQNIPNFSKFFQNIPIFSKSCQIFPNHSKFFQITPKYSKSLLILPIFSKSFQIFPNHSKLFKNIPNVSKKFPYFSIKKSSKPCYGFVGGHPSVPLHDSQVFLILVCSTFPKSHYFRNSFVMFNATLAHWSSSDRKIP